MCQTGDNYKRSSQGPKRVGSGGEPAGHGAVCQTSAFPPLLECKYLSAFYKRKR